MSIFKATPSPALYQSILAIARDPDETDDKLMEYLSSSATSSSENFSAALEIYASNFNEREISALLESHSHLLRPRDALIYQGAVAVLGLTQSCLPRILQIVEKEFIVTLRAISAALSTSFSNIGEEENKKEMNRILKLRQGSTSREDRVREWVDAVLTPGTASPHPMALAAMMIGLPFVPQLNIADGSDPLDVLDINQDDEDLEDLRDERRPKLKERFDGWNGAAMSMEGGPRLLVKVYQRLIELMPFIQAADAVDEMISRCA